MELKHYFTGKNCKNGHLSKRRAADNKCLLCDSDKAKSRRANPKKNLAINDRRRRLRNGNPEKTKNQNALRRKAYKADPELKDKIKFSHWKKRFGVDQDMYKKILKQQKYLCAICRKEESTKRKDRLISLSIDHCHETGSIRGLLCRRCNVALGLAKDNADILIKAANYLAKRKRLK
ncbi:endonuclease VII domain-containing protein [Pseudomonadales bacterium]|nr:endonuclease VII domain-containing protein [Pseudomonadales bacterium]